MGKLRKIGKKVSRALNKVFGKKLGSIIGMVGLYMTMSAVGDFFLSKIPTKVPPVEGLDDLEKIKDIEETAKTVETVSNVDEAKKVVDTIKNSDISSVANTPLDAMVQHKTEILGDAVSTEITTAPLTPKIDFVADVPTTAYETAADVKSFTDVSVKELKDMNADLGDFMTNFVEETKAFPGKAFNYITDGKFVGDVATGAGTAFLTSEILGPGEQPFISGGVARQPIMESAQAAHMRDIDTNSVRMAGGSSGINFMDLANQTLYGTGSASGLSTFYQPLDTPRVPGLMS